MSLNFVTPFGLRPSFSWDTLKPGARNAIRTSDAASGLLLRGTSRTSVGPARRGATTITCRRSSHNSRSGSRSAASTQWDSFAGGDGRRSNRVGELIRREIGPIISDVCYNDADTNGMMVSVVNVKMSQDLRNARVHVSVFGTGTGTDTSSGTGTTGQGAAKGSDRQDRQDRQDRKKREEQNMKDILDMLKRNQKEIRFKLAQSVQLKYMPQLSFHKSEMMEASNTMNILNQLARQREEKEKRQRDKGDVEVGVRKSADSTDDADDMDSDDDGLL